MVTASEVAKRVTGVARSPRAEVRLGGGLVREGGEGRELLPAEEEKGPGARLDSRLVHVERVRSGYLKLFRSSRSGLRI